MTQQQNPWSPPPQGAPDAQPAGAFRPAAPMSRAASLAGIGDAEARMRYSELPANADRSTSTFRVKVTGGRCYDPPAGQGYGLSYFLEGQVLAAEPQHASTVGQTFTCGKVNGFSDPKRRKMAIEELKGLLVSLYASRGLTTATVMDDEQWAQAADAALPEGKAGRESICIGVELMVSTRAHVSPTVNPKTGQPYTKVIYTFAPA